MAPTTVTGIRPRYFRILMAVSPVIQERTLSGQTPRFSLTAAVTGFPEWLFVPTRNSDRYGEGGCCLKRLGANETRSKECDKLIYSGVVWLIGVT